MCNEGVGSACLNIPIPAMRRKCYDTTGDGLTFRGEQVQFGPFTFQGLSIGGMAFWNLFSPSMLNEHTLAGLETARWDRQLGVFVRSVVCV